MPITRTPYPRNVYEHISPTALTQQYVGNRGSMVGGQFESGRSTWSEQWAFIQDDFQTFINDVLGWSMKGESSKIMKRKLPAQSKQFPQMRASRISGIEALAPTGQKGDGGLASFNEIRATIQFETPPYDMLTDDQLAAPGTGIGDAGYPAEAFRYVIWDVRPAGEFARTNRDAWKYPPNTGSKNQNKPITGSGGQALLLTKTRITALWIQVPDAWVVSGTVPGGPDAGDDAVCFTNLEATLGTVNDGEFLGRPRGTMLFESFEPTPRVLPVSPEAIGIVEPGFFARCWDIKLQWLYFNPGWVYDKVALKFVPTMLQDPTKLGHNLVFNLKSAGGPKWERALIARSDAVDIPENWLYQESDHDRLFKAV
jgi:hypothetical protein